MNSNKWRTSLLALLIATISSTAAAAAVEPIEPIPTMLVATSDPTEYPDPICSKCTIIVIEDEDSAESRADVRVAYPLGAPSFVGEIAVTVWLENNERRTVWLTDVSLEPGDEVELVADAEEDWSWDQVRFVWLRFVSE
jgi:hypothetical protein